MKYDINRYDARGVAIECATAATAAQAQKIARGMAQRSKDGQVFIEWYRPQDGQRGYLNPDGHHDITGKAY